MTRIYIDLHTERYVRIDTRVQKIHARIARSNPIFLHYRWKSIGGMVHVSQARINVMRSAMGSSHESDGIASFLRDERWFESYINMNETVFCSRNLCARARARDVL